MLYLSIALSILCVLLVSFGRREIRHRHEQHARIAQVEQLRPISTDSMCRILTVLDDGRPRTPEMILTADRQLLDIIVLLAVHVLILKGLVEVTQQNGCALVRITVQGRLALPLMRDITSSRRAVTA